jgi:hypothetical protein
MVALSNVAIALFAALMPQYAIVSLVAAFTYYAITTILMPLCEWPRRYDIIATTGFAAVPIYVYALDRALREYATASGVDAGWMAIQVLSVVFSASTSTIGYIFALNSLRPPKKLRSMEPIRWTKKHVPSLIRPPWEGDLIKELATGDVCNASQHNALRRLICDRDLSVADELPDDILIIATYYAILRRGDFNLAGTLLEVLKSRDLHFSDEDMVNILKAAYKAIKTCDVKHICKTAVGAGTASLFKELVALHFADAETAKKVAERLKCKALKASTQYEIYDSKRGLYIEYRPSPLLYFIYHAADVIKPLPTCPSQSQ